MGGCVSQALSEEEKERTRQIEVQLQRGRLRCQEEVKLLLLGSGDSGKSTFAKQVKILFDAEFSEEERKQFSEVIHSNVWANMRCLVMATQKMGLTLSGDNAKRSEPFASLASQEVTGQVAEDIKALWADPAIQEAYGRASEFQLGDSAGYFFDSLDRLTEESFVPSEQDVLRSRSKTTEITETEFQTDGLHVKMLDVGGHRPERKQWMHCLQEVSAVLFFVALSEYDLMLAEDETIFRMHESLKLYDEVASSRWFRETPMILFLNKNDLFRTKIKVTDLRVCFPDYRGGKNYNKAIKYIEHKFTSRGDANRRRKTFPHCVTVTDTSNVRHVFSTTRDIMIMRSLCTSS